MGCAAADDEEEEEDEEAAVERSTSSSSSSSSSSRWVGAGALALCAWRLCAVRSLCRTYLAPQSAHWKAPSVRVCAFMCTLRPSVVLYSPPHSVHVKKSPVCWRLCRSSSECHLKVFPQTSQVVSWRCTMCAASRSRLGNVASHLSHPKTSMQSGCAWRQCLARLPRVRDTTSHKLHAKGRTSSHARVVAR
jgi:hypothetical protein